MGTIDSALTTRMRAFGDLTALVGSRIFPWPAPDKTAGYNPYPCVVYWQEHGRREAAMGGPTGLVKGEFQIDILGETIADVRAVADQVRLCLDGFSGLSDGIEIDHVELDDEDADPFVSRMPAETMWIEQYYLVHWRETVSG